MRQRRVAATGRLGAASAPSSPDVVSGCSAGTGLGVRERRMAASRSPAGTGRRTWPRSSSGAAPEHVYDCQAGDQLGVRERRMATAGFATRGWRASAGTATCATASTCAGLVLDAGSIWRTRRGCLHWRRLGAKRSPARG